MKYNNILLIRTDRIGDVVLTTPAIKLLHEVYPKARLFFLTRDYTAPLLKHHPYLHEILIYKPDADHKGWTGHLKLSRTLKERQIDLAFLFYPQASIAFSLFMAGIPNRIGTGYRWFSFLLNFRKYEHRKYGKKHELEYNLSLLENFIPRLPTPSEITFDFTVDSTLQKLKHQILEKYQLKQEYIIIHPGSGGSAPNLPPQKYAAVLEYLAQHTQSSLILVGDPSERALISQIAEQSNANPVQILGDWDLESYMAMISGAEYFISNSTGPLHIARAYNVPLLSFYCPAIPCSPERWGPYNQLHNVMIPPVNPCKTCNIDKCPHGNCLANISWESIQSRLDQFLSQK
ncbi:MAG: glycosyltransferase family 9 protein [bacterium]|nr:MAG: glycosyltransferase family 9 protein [bacterium]